MMQRNCLGILFLSPTNVFANYLLICYCQYYCRSSSLLLWFIKMVFPIYSCHFIMLGGSGVIRNLASNLAYLKKNLATIQHKLSTLIATRSRVGLATQAVTRHSFSGGAICRWKMWERLNELQSHVYWLPPKSELNWRSMLSNA